MPHELKFQIGETVIANGTGEGKEFFGDRAIIIGSRVVLGKYFSYLQSDDDRYDERDAEHTFYSTFSTDRKTHWWYWENDIEKYCINTERGIKELRGIQTLIQSLRFDYNTDFNTLKTYSDKYLGLEIS